MKTVIERVPSGTGHWVGDGFPVRSLFSYGGQPKALSPFLLLDYAGPYEFTPAAKPRGVGQHPHRGFETVTIVYAGEVAHKDSTGNGGVIGPGDVQWMTAGAGILHEEFHSPAFTKAGGTLEMVQLWVNLPAKDKMTPPGYQGITDAQIPSVSLPDGVGLVRVIAGHFGNATGTVQVNGQEVAREADLVTLTSSGTEVLLEANSDAVVLLLSGEPIDEPIVGYGPFVMNTEEEIRQAMRDFQSGNFGQIAD
ncbi:pirin family protein [Marinimicrobium sp. LS-A18]|uniref:pirin family protein n=1 Tax=Marinimicrobium sp. LS-A18 TaxID=1381596 RepID=UPI000464D5F8|nr:pirin family protein [Marinimicrobium sp. LS-A18]